MRIFWVEAPGISLTRFRELVPVTKKIFFVRDFRDVLCSMISCVQNEKRVTFFNHENSKNAEYISKSIEYQAKLLYNQWKLHENDSCFVRYEDLIQRPETVFQRIINYLEVSDNTEQAGSIVKNIGRKKRRLKRLKRESSVGNYPSCGSQAGLSEELFESFTNNCTEALKGFGYEV